MLPCITNRKRLIFVILYAIIIDKERVNAMCKLMEDYAEKRAREAARESSVSIAVELWNDGIYDMEKIAKLTKLPLDEVKKLFEGKTA